MNLQNQIDYLKRFYNQDMFDDCAVPDGLNMERVRGAIVMRCGLLAPLFSEPETQRFATQQFFFENQWNFKHIVEVLKSEYSPIENVAEVREEKTTHSGADTLTINKGTTETHSGTDNHSVAHTWAENVNHGGETTTTHTISAENVQDYSADRQETTYHNETDSTQGHGNDIDDFTHGEVIAQSGADKHTSVKGTETNFSVNRHGNIGMTTNQDMINQELELVGRFNPYRFIADMYEKEMMIGLY